MSRRHKVAAIVAALIAVVSFPGLTGTVSAQSVEPVEIIRTDVSDFPTVRLAVALSGDAAEANPDADDIVITENGQPVDAELEALSDERIDVVLVMDISGSMAGEPIAQAKLAALQFIDGLPDNAEVAVVSFGDTAQVESEFTTDRDASRGAVQALDDGGETALYDGVSLGAELVGSSDAARSAIVVLSDGGDTVSEASLEAATGALGGTETDFFAVSLQTGEADEAALGSLAEAAGGQVVPASDPEALTEAYVDLGQRIVNQYVVTFESTTPDPTGTFAVTVTPTGDSDSIEIALPDRGGTATTEAAAPGTPERLITEGDAAPLEQDWAMWVGAGLIGLALAITAFAVVPASRPTMRRRSLHSDRVVADDAGTGERIVESVRGAATRFTTAAVARSERTGTIDDALDRAGLIMRAGEFVALVFGVVVAAALVLGLLLGAVGVAIGVLVPVFGAPTFLRFMASRRNRKFADQLSDTLLLMAGSLRSGFGVAQTIDSVAQEMEPPIGVEFQRALLEMRLGRTVEDSLSAVARRMDNEDFEWVVDAIRINQQVGGDLAQILDQVSETIRARNRLKRQISALTAEGRMSGIVLAALPIMLGLVLYGSNREYLEPLWQETAGLIMLVGAVGLLVAGALWLKKLVNVEL